MPDDWPYLDEEIGHPADCEDGPVFIPKAMPEAGRWELYFNTVPQEIPATSDDGMGEMPAVIIRPYRLTIRLQSWKSYDLNEPAPVVWTVEELEPVDRRPHYRVLLVVYRDVGVRVRRPDVIGERWVSETVPGEARTIRVLEPVMEYRLDVRIIRCQDIHELPPPGSVANFASTFFRETHVYINKSVPLLFYLEGDDVSRRGTFARRFLTDYVPPAIQYEADGTPIADDDLFSNSFIQNVITSRRSDHAIIKPRADGVDIACSTGTWEVSLTNRGRNRRRSGYWFDIRPAIDLSQVPEHTMEWHLAQKTFRVRIICTETVEVSGGYERNYHGNPPVHVEVYRVPATQGHLLPLPLMPIPEGSYNFTDVTYDNTIIADQTWRRRVQWIVTLISMIPVVGTLVDIAHLGYMAYTGRNFWGERVAPGDLLLEGGFLIVGIIMDVDDAVKLAGLVGEVFTGSTRRIVKSNPGLVDEMAEAIWKSMPLDVRAAANGFRGDKQMQQAILDEIARLAEIRKRTGTIPNSEQAKLIELLTEVMSGPGIRLLDDAAAADGLSVMRMLEDLHPSHLPGFDDLDPASRKSILDRFDRLRGDAIDTLRQGGALADVARLHDEFLDDLLDIVEQPSQGIARQIADHARFNLIVDPDSMTFRNPVLARGYAGYLAERAAANIGSSADDLPMARLRNMVDWLGKQRSGVCHDEATRALGGDVAGVLSRLDPVRYYDMSPDTVRGALRRIFTGDRVMLKPGVPFFYGDLRGHLRGYGKLFEVDHCIEKRFLKHPLLDAEGVELFDNRMFQSMIVPKNRAVQDLANREARLMGEFGTDLAFRYTHDRKTEMMRRLIPYTDDLGDYSFQEILDAHALVFKQLGFEPGFVRSVLYDEMGYLAEVARDGADAGSALHSVAQVIDPSSETISAILARNPRFLNIWPV